MKTGRSKKTLPANEAAVALKIFVKPSEIEALEILMMSPVDLETARRCFDVRKDVEARLVRAFKRQQQSQ